MDVGSIVLALLSGLISGIIVSYITNKLNNNNRKKNQKIELIKNIIGYSYEIIPDYQANEYHLNKHLNQIYITFNDSELVLKAAVDCKEKITTDKFVTLVKAMWDDVNIKYDKINDSFITKPFIIRD